LCAGIDHRLVARADPEEVTARVSRVDPGETGCHIGGFMDPEVQDADADRNLAGRSQHRVGDVEYRASCPSRVPDRTVSELLQLSRHFGHDLLVSEEELHAPDPESGSVEL